MKKNPNPKSIDPKVLEALNDLPAQKRQVLVDALQELQLSHDVLKVTNEILTERVKEKRKQEKRKQEKQ